MATVHRAEMRDKNGKLRADRAQAPASQGRCTQGDRRARSSRRPSCSSSSITPTSWRHTSRARCSATTSSRWSTSRARRSRSSSRNAAPRSARCPSRSRSTSLPSCATRSTTPTRDATSKAALARHHPPRHLAGEHHPVDRRHREADRLGAREGEARRTRTPARPHIKGKYGYVAPEYLGGKLDRRVRICGRSASSCTSCSRAAACSTAPNDFETMTRVREHADSAAVDREPAGHARSSTRS